MVKMALITGFLGQTRDRFHVYNREIDFETKIRMTSELEGYSGVEIVYPYETSLPEQTLSILERYGISVAAVNVNIKAEPEFRDGGLTAADGHVRARAISMIKEAKDFAEKIRADKVTCCPLADGYEFVFQYDYALAWKRLVESIGEAASYNRRIPLFIEYKPSETRGHCYIDNAAKTLLLLRDIGMAEIGVTLDFGHSIYGLENPAEAVTLLESSPYPYYVHINDNDGRWDWDYFCCTKHYLEYIEFLFYLKKYGYDDFMTSDTMPTRWDIRGTFEANSKITQRIWAALDSKEFRELMNTLTSDDYLGTWDRIREIFFKV